MEPTQTTPIQTQQSQTVPQDTSQKRKKIWGLLAVFLLLFGVGISAFFVLQSKPQPNTNTQNNDDQLRADEAALKKTPYHIVFGTKNDTNTLLSVYDLTKQQEKPFVTLPKNIKRITLISPGELLFINETNLYDNGQSLVLYNLEQQGIVKTIQASPGYFIDEYAISPSRQYIAIWEIQPDIATGVLSGGRSRVYGIDLRNPDTKYLIYDERATFDTSIHYPSGVTNTGKVFMDSFIPNVGTGWAFGASIANFDGTDKRELPSMQNGTYGTKLFPSPDGRYILFGGYDGVEGSGDVLIDGERVAIQYVNTVEVFDTEIEQRVLLPNIPSGNRFVYVNWSQDSTKIIYTMLGKKLSDTGVYVYDVAKKTSQKLLIQHPEIFMTALPNGIFLSGETAEDVGSLGYTYMSPFTSLNIRKESSDVSLPLELTDGERQLITTVSSDYFGDVLGTRTIAQSNRDNLQLQPYYPPTKTPTPIPSVTTRPLATQAAGPTSVQPTQTPTVTPTPTRGLIGIRKNQQSNPSNPEPSGPKPTKKPTQQLVNCGKFCDYCWSQPGTIIEQDRCYKECAAYHKQTGQCHASPLYLYGKPGTRVTVKIHTPLFNAIPAYTNGYNIILGDNGVMTVNGQERLRSIKFDYNPALRSFDRPQRGRIVKKDDVTEVLTEYASKLGLAKKETEDLIAYGKTAVTKPYVFVSFFDQQTSKSLLPMTFTPQPDVYINIVFYFKEYSMLPLYSIQAPDYPQLPARNGFTAVEISGMVE